MKGFKTLNVKKDTYEMITDLGTSGMSQDDVIKMLIRNSAELRDAKQEIERLNKALFDADQKMGELIKTYGEVMEAEAGRE